MTLDGARPSRLFAPDSAWPPPPPTSAFVGPVPRPSHDVWEESGILLRIAQDIYYSEMVVQVFG